MTNPRIPSTEITDTTPHETTILPFNHTYTKQPNVRITGGMWAPIGGTYFVRPLFYQSFHVSHGGRIATINKKFYQQINIESHHEIELLVKEGANFFPFSDGQIACIDSSNCTIHDIDLFGTKKVSELKDLPVIATLSCSASDKIEFITLSNSKKYFAGLDNHKLFVFDITNNIKFTIPQYFDPDIIDFKDDKRIVTYTVNLKRITISQFRRIEKGEVPDCNGFVWINTYSQTYEIENVRSLKISDDSEHCAIHFGNGQQEVRIYRIEDDILKLDKCLAVIPDVYSYQWLINGSLQTVSNHATTKERYDSYRIKETRAFHPAKEQLDAAIPLPTDFINEGTVFVLSSGGIAAFGATHSLYIRTPYVASCEQWKQQCWRGVFNHFAKSDGWNKLTVDTQNIVIGYTCPRFFSPKKTGLFVPFYLSAECRANIQTIYRNVCKEYRVASENDVTKQKKAALELLAELLRKDDATYNVYIDTILSRYPRASEGDKALTELFKEIRSLDDSEVNKLKTNARQIC